MTKPVEVTPRMREIAARLMDLQLCDHTRYAWQRNVRADVGVVFPPSTDACRTCTQKQKGGGA